MMKMPGETNDSKYFSQKRQLSLTKVKREEVYSRVKTSMGDLKEVLAKQFSNRGGWKLSSLFWRFS